MTPPDKRPPPLPGKPILDQQPERAAVRMPRAEPPKRTQTLPGIPSLAMPPLPGELAPTLPVPNPLQRLTVRRPTPPSTVVLARRTPVPPSDDPPPAPNAASGQPDASLPPMSESPDAASNEALRRRAEAAEAERDEFRRRERVRAEAAGPGPYQKPVERHQTPVPSSAPTKSDAALGAGVRHLLGRFAPFLLAAAGIGGGVTAVAKPSADPEKADATLASVEELGRKLDRVDAKVNGLLDREPQLTEFVECLYEQQADYFEQLLPSQQRLVTGSLQRTWVDRCRNRRPKR